jgi:hypothetical protein
MLSLAENIGTRKIIAAGIRQSLQEAAGLEGQLKTLQKGLADAPSLSSSRV